jgi:hypothetical protein
MRKAFRAATAFTGAAACAAAFTPAAIAATANTHEIKPDMEKKNCAIGPLTTSVVFYWAASADHGPTCVGGGGAGKSVNLSSHYFAAACYGNNNGTFWASHSAYRHNFTYGSSIDIVARDVGKVEIKSWPGGNTRCPTSGVP